MNQNQARTPEDNDIGRQLTDLELDPANSIVIGSGILEALGIRSSRDIDLVVDQESYQLLESRSDLEESSNCNTPVLVGQANDVRRELEIYPWWSVLNADRDLTDLSRQSVVIRAVRYVSLDFLLAVKQSWLEGDNARPKHRADVDLIQNYQKGRPGPDSNHRQK